MTKKTEAMLKELSINIKKAEVASVLGKDKEQLIEVIILKRAIHNAKKEINSVEIEYEGRQW